MVILRRPSKRLRNCRIFSRQGVLSLWIFHVNPLSLGSFGNTYSIFINRLRKDIRPSFRISNLLDQIFMNRRQTVVRSIDYTENICLNRQMYQKAMVIVAHVINDQSFGCPIAIGSNFEIVHHDDRFRSLFCKQFNFFQVIRSNVARPADHRSAFISQNETVSWAPQGRPTPFLPEVTSPGRETFRGAQRTRQEESCPRAAVAFSFAVETRF